MALQGTLSDFGLAEIFQLIGLQRKTGVLTLECEEDTVKVYFEEGLVVSADTRQRNLEDLIGSVLIRGGLLEPKQLKRALRQQKRTLQRLGYLLLQMHFISPQELGRALHVQVSQIVQRLFRWRTGQFQFTTLEAIDYDRDIFAPITTECLLMEGARMIDEWPLLERKIPTDGIIFNITALGQEGLNSNHSDSGKMVVGSDLVPDPAIHIDPDWAEMLQSVNGVLTVRELCERSDLSEFDCYRGLCEFLSADWIVEIQPVRAQPNSRRSLNVKTLLTSGLMVLCFSAGVLGISKNVFVPWRTASLNELIAGLRDDTDKMRLERIQDALRVYYLLTGGSPVELAELGDLGLLSQESLLDAQGRPYRYEPTLGGYVLSRVNSPETSQEALEIRKSFSPAQRAMMEGSF